MLMNSCALIALKRSKTLCPTIRVFSMNFLASNLLFCTAFSLMLGSPTFSHNIEDNCIPKLLGAALMFKSYFVTSFSITAMALDRLVAIVFPFKYVELFRWNRMKKACVSIWGLGFLIALSYNISNWHLIFRCVSHNFNSSSLSTELFMNNLTIIGIINVLLLILNVILFLLLFTYIVKKNYKERLYAISILKRLSVIFAVYALLYGPFCIATVVMSIFPGERSTLVALGNYTVTPLLLTFIVDPILYAWRYKMCRLHMMKILCFFRKSKVEEIRKTLNDHYCTYEIQTIRRTGPSLV